MIFEHDIYLMVIYMSIHSYYHLICYFYLKIRCLNHVLQAYNIILYMYSTLIINIFLLILLIHIHFNIWYDSKFFIS